MGHVDLHKLVLHEKKYQDCGHYFESDGSSFIILLDGYQSITARELEETAIEMEQLVHSGGLERLVIAIKSSNQFVMPATICVVEANEKQVRWLSLGDVRLYAGKHLLTEDDTTFWRNEKRKGATQKVIALSACESPLRGVLCRSLAVNFKEAEIKVFSFKKPIKFIVCTDGCWQKHHVDITSGNTFLHKRNDYQDDATAVFITYS